VRRLGTPSQFPHASAARGTRVPALCALVAAVVVLVVLFTSSGPQYTIRLAFQDASGLVPGDQVMIGPAPVGSVDSIGLSPNGQAIAVVSLDSSASPMHEGTVARIYENSLAGIASKYIALELGPPEAPPIPSGGTISSLHTYSEVSLDQIFDLFTAPTRRGLAGFVRGEAASIAGRSRQARRTLLYLQPGLASTAAVTRQLSLYEPRFETLLTAGGRTMQLLASRTSELTQLIAHTETATGAIAARSQSLSAALSLLPGALTRSTRTFAGLRATLDALTPLVDRSKPASRQLAPFAAALRAFSAGSIPTLRQLADLIANPGRTGDLTTLLQEAPGLSHTASTALPALIEAMNDSQPQVDYLREYTPDVVAALADLGQASGYYDANGHYLRSQPFFGAFTVNAQNQLTPLPANLNRDDGLQAAHGRCPGSAVQPPPDGSAPVKVPGCNPASVPAGP
jgi:phospholipid/cholesterol/gamma-HCH transport system substrate-binding protein